MLMKEVVEAMEKSEGSQSIQTIWATLFWAYTLMGIQMFQQSTEVAREVLLRCETLSTSDSEIILDAKYILAIGLNRINSWEEVGLLTQ